jgi:flagellar hook-associated protein 1 FlgK
MDLVGVIMNAGEGLGVYRAQVATTSHNIANANTPGYARQDAVPTETTPDEEIGVNGYIGRGVALAGVVQARDKFVETQISVAFANSASSSAGWNYRCAREILFVAARPESESGGPRPSAGGGAKCANRIEGVQSFRRLDCIGQKRNRPECGHAG